MVDRTVWLAAPGISMKREVLSRRIGEVCVACLGGKSQLPKDESCLVGRCKCKYTETLWKTCGVLSHSLEPSCF